MCNEFAELTKKAVAFHGHRCPGLSFGIRAAAWALEHMGCAADEEIVAITETDMCAVDAIQALVGCTFGKGNLLYRPYGKVAFSFYRRSDGKSARLVQHPAFRAAHQAASGITREQASLTSQASLAREALMEAIMTAPFEELYILKPAPEPLPAPARIMETGLCARCGEGVMVSCLQRRGHELYCLACEPLPCESLPCEPLRG